MPGQSPESRNGEDRIKNYMISCPKCTEPVDTGYTVQALLAMREQREVVTIQLGCGKCGNNFRYQLLPTNPMNER
jgi:RNase P subunit RPR2